MVKKDIVKEVRARVPHLSTAEITTALNTFYEVVKDAVKEGQTVKLPLGTFRVVETKETRKRSMQTGELFTVPRKLRTRFQPASDIKVLSIES